MPYIVAAVRAGATTGEVSGVLGEVFGPWQERPIL
jgi:methylmalonyl-CoA mutase N-terminal domain/subunit